jgi:hypothetical protein
MTFCVAMFAVESTPQRRVPPLLMASPPVTGWTGAGREHGSDQPAGHGST